MNKFLLAGDKFIPEMHLRQPSFTCSGRGPFTKNKERIEKFMQTGNTDVIYKNELNKACFQHDMAYGKSKDLAKRTQSGKVLRDKAFKIASDLKHNVYQRGLASKVYKFFDKKSASFLLMNQIISLQMSFTNRLLKHLKREKFIHRLETIFVVLI